MVVAYDSPVSLSSEAAAEAATFEYEWPELKGKLERRERYRRARKGLKGLKVKRDCGEIVDSIENDDDDGDDEGRYEDFGASGDNADGNADDFVGEREGGSEDGDEEEEEDGGVEKAEEENEKEKEKEKERQKERQKESKQPLSLPSVLSLSPPPQSLSPPPQSAAPSAPSSVAKVSPSKVPPLNVSSKVFTKKELLAQLAVADQMAKTSEAASFSAAYAAALINECPMLAGPVYGFGEELENSTDNLITNRPTAGTAGMLKNSIKAPSSERLFEGGMGDAGYYGGADVYVQRPTSAVDRRLLAAVGWRRADRYSTRAALEQTEEGEEGEADEEGRRGRKEEEVREKEKEEAESGGTQADGTEVIRRTVSGPLEELGEEVVRLTSRLVVGLSPVPPIAGETRQETTIGPLRDFRGRTLLDLAWRVLPPEKCSMYSVAYGFGPFTNSLATAELWVANCHNENSCHATSADMVDLAASPAPFDGRMMLDYVPALRSISRSEVLNEERERAAGEEEGGRRRSSLGRRTSGRNRCRRHYLDEVGCNVERDFNGRNVAKDFIKHCFEM